MVEFSQMILDGIREETDKLAFEIDEWAKVAYDKRNCAVPSYTDYLKFYIECFKITLRRMGIGGGIHVEGDAVINRDEYKTALEDDLRG